MPITILRTYNCTIYILTQALCSLNNIYHESNYVDIIATNRFTSINYECIEALANLLL